MIISKNSYLILWLNSDADEKILNKRYKELLNFLNIDEVWLYNNDFSFIDYKKLRTEENIKEAFHNLSNQSKKLYQTFFRFQLVDDKDEKCMSDIISWNYVEWSGKWLELFEKTKKYHYLKNHIVWELLFYENKNKFKDLSFTDVLTTIVDLLHKLLTSEVFWKEFKEIFNIQNEIAIREDMIESFKNEIPQFIAEHFFDISEEIGDSKLYKEFSKKFSISAKELDDNKNVTESIKNIEDTLKSIKDMNLSEELDEIIDGVNEITGEIKKLDALWLENNHKIIKLKDEVATDIRTIAISLFNDHNNINASKNVMNMAIYIAYSNNLKEKIKEDNKQIEINIKELEKIGNPHKCFYCKKNQNSISKEYIFPIHRVVSRVWSNIQYQTAQCKIPRCNKCYEWDELLNKQSYFLSFLTSIIVWWLIAYNNSRDMNSGGIWYIIFVLLSWWQWAMPFKFVMWLFRMKTWWKENSYPLWKSLRKEWRLKWEKPHNVR